MRQLQALPDRSRPVAVTDIAANLAAIRAKVDAASARSGRDGRTVAIVGAAKGQPVEKLLAAQRAGLTICGENRVQEGLAKAPALPAELEWHLLGPLQSNKVGAALRIFTLFHAVDRVKIAHALDEAARRAGKTIAGLVEVNLGGESSKHGFAPDGLAAAMAPFARFEHLAITGLMTLPPPSTDPATTRGYFRRLRELKDDLARRPEWRGRLTELSMGMSDDFELAVEEGATFVRIGTLLFGDRAAAAVRLDSD